MAVKAKKTKIVDKWRKKKYFSIMAPKMFQERELGQTLAYESNTLQGRCIKTNLMMITGNIKRQDINVTFRVNKVLGDTAYTFLESYEIMPAAVKRKVRRQKDKIDESFNCVTKDNKLIRMKPLIMTAGKTSRSVTASLRDKIKQFTVLAARKLDYDSFTMDIINEKFQKDLGNMLNKVTPIRVVAIRIMKFMGDYKGDIPLPEVKDIAEKPAEPEDVKEEESESADEGSESAEGTESVEEESEDDSEESATQA